MIVRKALLLLVAGMALLAGCGGGDDDEGAGTIEQLRIAYTSGAERLTADTWTLQGGVDAASRSRLRDGNEVTSDVALSEGFVSLYTPDSGGVVTSPAGSAPVTEPFTIARALVESGDLTADGTEEREGRTVEAFTGPAGPFVAGDGGTVEPAGAAVRYLRERDGGEPVELRIPVVRVTAEGGGGSARLPAQRYVVSEYREYPATEEAMEVFDLSAIYDGAGATTAPSRDP
jgi:hypothetical protein